MAKAGYEKVDYKKDLKEFYRPSAKKIAEVTVPRMNFLMIEGFGEPNADASTDYAKAIAALYPVAYTLKFMVREQTGIDYGVMPLEGLWWADDMADFVNDNKADWRWNMMIMQPPLVSQPLVEEALEKVKDKKDLEAIEKLRFDSFDEGLCLQTLHVGPFSEEGPTIARIHEQITDSGHALTGKHHEIYLTDIRRAAPENWKTVLRQPMV